MSAQAALGLGVIAMEIEIDLERQTVAIDGAVYQLRGGRETQHSYALRAPSGDEVRIDYLAGVPFVSGSAEHKDVYFTVASEWRYANNRALPRLTRGQMDRLTRLAKGEASAWDGAHPDCQALLTHAVLAVEPAAAATGPDRPGRVTDYLVITDTGTDVLAFLDPQKIPMFS